MKVLISGFEPFLEIKENPSQLLANELKSDYDQISKSPNTSANDSLQSVFSKITMESVILPVEYERAFVVLKETIDKFKPDLVLATGVAASRKDVGLERIAINHRSILRKDNTGNKPSDFKIHSTGPDGVFSNLDVDSVVAATNEKRKTNLYYSNSDHEDFTFKVSNTAGTYVCNALMYYLFLDAKMNSYSAGFLHIPNYTDQASIQKFKDLVLNILGTVSKSE